jgi:hypothetical protein
MKMKGNLGSLSLVIARAVIPFKTGRAIRQDQSGQCLSFSKPTLYYQKNGVTASNSSGVFLILNRDVLNEPVSREAHDAPH